MALAAAKWQYDRIHEELPFHDGSFKVWRAERTDRTPYHYLDGVRLWVSVNDLTPDDDFLTDPRDLMTPSIENSEEDPDGGTP